MKLPNQSQPVLRTGMESVKSNAVNPSSCGCGGGLTCYGACVFGSCLGVCA